MAVAVKTTDPFWWALFSAGGTLAAFLLPVHVLVTGVGIGSGWVDPDVIGYQRVHAWMQNPLIKLYLLLLISLSLFHWAHRFRYVLIDMGLRSIKTAVAVLCLWDGHLGYCSDPGLAFLLSVAAKEYFDRYEENEGEDFAGSVQIEKIGMISRINRFHLEQFAYFLEKLQSIEEGDGTPLDQMMIVCGSGLSDGNDHEHHDLPVVVGRRRRRDPEHRETCPLCRRNPHEQSLHFHAGPHGHAG